MNIVVPTIIMVYNANGAILSALGDIVHKIVSPSTYPCSLCALTYGPFSMRPEWRKFLSRLRYARIFLYRDEFRDDLGFTDLPLPAIRRARGPGTHEVLVSADELNALPDLETLMELVKERLKPVNA